MSAPPTEPFFPGLIFNISFFTAGDEPVTLNYVNNNFLKCVGYAYSRAIATTFNGGIFALGGISTSDITATGTITAAFFTGSGVNLTNLNASNISTGTLSVSRGGTGLNTIPLGSLLIGNGANTLLQTTNLSWDNTNSILNATNFSGSYSGSGAGLINLNVSNANAGTLPIGRGGTGTTTFISGRLLYGDGVNPLAQSANLTWNNTNNTLNTTNVNSSAYFINGSPFTPYTLPTANAATLGGIKVGNNLSIDGNGVLSATSSGLTGADIFLDGGVNNRAYGWTGATSLLGRVGTAGAYSLNSLAEDVILRSQGRILLQSGTNVPGVTIETTTNNVIIRNSLGIGITTFGAGDILDVGGVFKVAYNGVTESITIRSTGINVNNTLNVSSGTNNGGIIRFGGFSDDSSLDLATIQNRQYATNKSELLLFKGDNIEGLTGADRIRLRAAAIAFDTFSTDVTTSATTENIRMYIDNTGNVGIGTTTPLSNYLLDVRGNIISTGNIALVNASTSIFWTGTSSNLARAGAIGEYSTSAVINDIVLRSSNKLILQSGTGMAGLIIDTANNIGINTVIPSATLDIVKTHNAATNIDIFKMRFDTNWGLKFEQSYTGAGNIQYNLIHRYNTVDYNSLTFKGANVGIANTNPTGPLCVGNSQLAGSDGFIVIGKNNGAGGARSQYIGYNSNFDLVIGDYGGGTGPLVEAFKINYNAPVNSFIINNLGNVAIDRILLIGGFNNYNGGNVIKFQVYASDGSGIAAIFKHPNDTQGVGILYDGLQALGSNANQDINIRARGSGGRVVLTTNGSNRLIINGSTYHEFLGTSATGYANYIYFGNGNASFGSAYTFFGDLVVKFNGSTWATSWVGASSSIKIKKDIQDLDDNECLNKLLALRPVKYRYIDITKNFDPQKSVYGFIAEEVKEVLPEAVNDKEKELIPNIYLMGSVENDILTIGKELEIDVEYTCYYEKETIKIKVLEDLSNNNYKIDKTYEIKTDLFVYGKVDNNFHILKKEYFHALTISSVQELHKIIMEQKNKINDLETRLSILESIIVNNRQ